MKPLRRRNGNQHMHREPLDSRDLVKRRLNAYHVFIQAGLIAQGLLQYLAAVFPNSSGIPSDLGCARFDPVSPPSELVVATAMRQRLAQFLLYYSEGNIFKIFILDRKDKDKIERSRMAA